MKRFFNYIHLYENNSRIKNAGFLKIETTNDDVSFELHLKGLGQLSQTTNLLLYVNQKTPCALSIGKVCIVNGTCEERLSTTYHHIIESPFSFSDIACITIILDQNTMLISSLVEEDGASFAQRTYPLWKKEKPTLEKIDLTDLHTFPKSNWSLCNNSFLLHGFFQYHYLVHKVKEFENEKKHYIGVPGTYSTQEKMMAALFGFPIFEPDEESTSHLGYWYCPLDM